MKQTVNSSAKEAISLTYPLFTEDGFYYEDESDQAMGIETKEYDNNGGIIKRLKMSNGKVAIIRELKGADMEKADRLHDGDKSKVHTAIMSLSVKIDDKPVVMEDLQQLKAKDYNKLKIASTTLNF